MSIIEQDRGSDSISKAKYFMFSWPGKEFTLLSVVSVSFKVLILENKLEIFIALYHIIQNHVVQ